MLRREGLGLEVSWGNLTKTSDWVVQKKGKKGTHTPRLHPLVLLWVLPSEDCKAL